MDQCTKLYEATGEKMQQDKIIFCYWKWCYCNREKITKQVEAETIVHGEKTLSIQIKNHKEIGNTSHTSLRVEGAI